MYDNKVHQLESEIKMFEASQQDADDYLKFAVAIWSVTKQGSGLTFSHMKEIFEKTLDEIDQKKAFDLSKI